MGRTFLILMFMLGMFSAMLNNCGGRMSGSQFAANAQLNGADSSDSDSSSDDDEDEEVDSNGAIVLERSSDGHFYADVQINGANVRALVDTGASIIALSRDDARSAGLATSIGMPEVIGRGADGDVHGEMVMLDRVSLGSKTAERMQAVVLNAGEQTLLGQSFLSKFDSVEIQGDRMLLR